MYTCHLTGYFSFHTLERIPGQEHNIQSCTNALLLQTKHRDFVWKLEGKGHEMQVMKAVGST